MKMIVTGEWLLFFDYLAFEKLMENVENDLAKYTGKLNALCVFIYIYMQFGRFFNNKKNILSEKVC